MTNMYPIAVGPHDVDHEEVEKLFAEELKQFRSGKDVLFYHGKFKKNASLPGLTLLLARPTREEVL